MSGIAIDLGNLFSPVPNPLPSNTQRPLQVFAAQVIEVIIDESSKLYKSEKDIGAIRFRNLSKEVNKEEDLIKNIAYPLDRSIVRYPMPGEQVMIFAAIGEVPTGAVQSIKRTYFYMHVVSTLHNVTYNGHPFIGTDANSINKLSPIDRGTAAIRFDKAAKDIAAVKEGDAVRIYKQLKPFEGDFILQGRYGNAIRFGSTKKDIPKGMLGGPGNKVQGGPSGDGFISFRVDRDTSATERGMLTNENLEPGGLGDDSLMVMATSQAVEITLACSKNMFTWQYIYDLPDTTAPKEKPDTSMRWAQFTDPVPTTNATGKAIQFKATFKSI